MILRIIDMIRKDDFQILGGSRKKVFFYGLLIWTLWIIFYAVFFKIQTAVHTWAIAFTASAGSYYTFALLSILIWFICKKIPFGRLPIPFLVLVHFFLSMIISSLWLFISYGAWYLAVGENMLQYDEIRATLGWQFLFGMITYLLIAGIFYTIITYRQFREKELREAELKLLTRDAELRALKMQIHPHFLFNSLNSINALVKQTPNQARVMIAKLSDLLRISLESRDKMLVPLKEELEFARLYLDIENIRFRDRMEFNEDIDPELMDQPFPGMVLQPLLENAVIHGIAEHRGKGTIRLSLNRHDTLIVCVVSNTVGSSKSKRKKGTGLDNIQQRLKLFYKEAYALEASLNKGWFDVRLTIPLNPEGIS